jgi:hypothetical protein
MMAIYCGGESRGSRLFETGPVYTYGLCGEDELGDGFTEAGGNILRGVEALHAVVKNY